MTAAAPRRVAVTDLDGVALSWAVARVHPQCEGLEYAMHAGVLCGWDNRPGEPRTLVLVFHEPGWLRRIRARKAVRELPEHEHALDYCPLEDWPLVGRLIESEGVVLSPDEEGDPLHESALTQQPEGPAGARRWRARIGSFEVRGQPSVPHAVLRAYVGERQGNDIELPAFFAT